MSKQAPFKIVRKNVPYLKRQDIYHDLLAANWIMIFMWFLIIFLLVNSFFATLYWLHPGSLHNSDNRWMTCFFFSVQTLGTIGYGYLSPATTMANILATIEAALGLITIAILGGLFFAKFSRPHSKIEFTRDAVINNYNGKPTFVFRMINIRKNQIIDANVSLNIMIEEGYVEGHKLRRFKEMKLVRSKVPMFSMSMTMMHVIDEESPLFGLTEEDLKNKDVEFYVTMVGTDGTLGQVIHGTYIYRHSNIFWGRKFKDMVEFLPDSTRVIDYSHFHELL